MDFDTSELLNVPMVMAFLAAVTFAEALLNAPAASRASRQKKAARDRLKRHATRIQRQEEDEDRSIFVDRQSRGPILQFLTSLIPDRKKLDIWIYRADVPMQLEGLLGVTALAMVVGFMAVNFVVGKPQIAISGALLGVAPWIYVNVKKNQRMQAFSEEFPNAIDLLCRSLKSGHPLNTGLRLVADEVEEPVAGELSQVVDEIGMGLDIRVALQNLGRRMCTEEMPFFVNALLIQRETGGDLPRVLASLAETTRSRLQFRLKVDAVVAQTKMSANVLAVLPFLFMGLMLVVNPAFVEVLFTTESGNMMLGAAMALTAVGYIFCRALVRVDV